MYRLFSVLAVGAALVFGFTPGHASPPPWAAVNATGPHGVIPSHGANRATRFSRTNNLVYHSGGSVQTGSKAAYAIYWNPWGATDNSTYQSVINKYFTDVASDSGKTSNVYYSDTQYYQTIGSTTYIQYNQSFAGSYVDTDTPSASGCSSTSGGSLGCISDAQMQQEVLNFVHANGLPEGLNAEYFMFLGKGVSSCAGSQCFVSYWCAYHSSFTDSSTGKTVLYANMPYANYSSGACGTGQAPTGNADADATLNVTSHEQNETITDPLGNAWYDRSGNENGDKCAWNFGTVSGTNGSEYNQTINGDRYYLQGEWSNHSSKCVWSGT